MIGPGSDKNGTVLNGEIQNIDSKSEIIRQTDDTEKEHSHHEEVDKFEEPHEVRKSEQKENECDFDEIRVIQENDVTINRKIETRF